MDAFVRSKYIKNPYIFIHRKIIEVTNKAILVNMSLFIRNAHLVLTNATEIKKNPFLNTTYWKL